MNVRSLWNGTCHETGERLSEHIERELRGLSGLRVTRHLARCELCQAVQRSLIRTIAALRSLSSFSPAPARSVAPAVVERIRREP